MTAISTNIKKAIKDHLETLRVAGTLGAYIVEDFRENLLDQDFPAYPCAILLPPAIASAMADNDANMRTYTFDIAVVVKKDEITSETYLEDLIETILDSFDNDITLSGTATAGSPPAASTPDEVTSASGTYVVFVVTLAPRAITHITL